MRLYLLVTRMLLAVGFGVSDGNGERPHHRRLYTARAKRWHKHHESQYESY